MKRTLSWCNIQSAKECGILYKRLFHRWPVDYFFWYNQKIKPRLESLTFFLPLITSQINFCVVNVVFSFYLKKYWQLIVFPIIISNKCKFLIMYQNRDSYLTINWTNVEVIFYCSWTKQGKKFQKITVNIFWTRSARHTIFTKWNMWMPHWDYPGKLRFFLLTKNTFFLCFVKAWIYSGHNMFLG